MRRVPPLLGSAIVLVASSTAHAAWEPEWVELPLSGGSHGERPEIAQLDDGRLLVTGGYGAETFDPITNTWAPAGSFPDRRYFHGLIDTDAEILVFGGQYAGDGFDDILRYTPGTETWEQIDTLPEILFYLRVVRLQDGRFLVLGEPDTLLTLESYIVDAQAQTWTSLGNIDIGGAWEEGVVILDDGRVHVSARDACMVFDPTNDAWSPAPAPNRDVGYHTTTLLADGRVLVSGTRELNDGTTFADLIDPDTLEWSATDPMSTAREGHAAVLLPDDDVLVVGGHGGDATAEIFDTASETWVDGGVPTYTSNRFGTATLVENIGVFHTSGSDGNRDASMYVLGCQADSPNRGPIGRSDIVLVIGKATRRASSRLAGGGADHGRASTCARGSAWKSSTSRSSATRRTTRRSCSPPWRSHRTRT